MASAREDLLDKINSFRQKAASSRLFVDPIKLKELFKTTSVVLSALRECGISAHQAPGLKAEILERGTNIFSILVCIGKPLLVQDFVQYQVFDNKLPLRSQDLERLPSQNELINSRFMDLQWEFIPHVFKRGPHCVIEEDSILPFQEELELTQLEGGFGSISEVIIYPACHSLVEIKDMKEVRLIRKLIKPTATAAEDFARERECLEILHSLEHPHIVELLCSYTYKLQNYFLFPRYEIDLNRFLGQSERFGKFQYDTTFYTALQGLSSALHCVHNLNFNAQDPLLRLSKVGYHHDLRPHNVLVTSRTFLLADFGLSRFKEPTGDQPSQTLWKAGKGDYLAPECMTDAFAHQVIGRPIDIWALGCMIIDVAMYMIRGSVGLKEFKAIRVTYWKRRHIENGVFYHGNKLKDEVLSQLRELQTCSKESELYGLIELARSMLKMEPQERPKSSQVCDKLTYLSIKALFHEAATVLNHYNAITMDDDQRPPMVSFWFEIERLGSWGAIIGLKDEHPLPSSFTEAVLQGPDERTSRVWDILGQITTTFRRELTVTADNSTAHGTMIQVLRFDNSLQKKLREYVQQLFDLLPTRIQRRADILWKHSLLETNDLTKLTGYVKESSSSTSSDYKDIKSRAILKKLRLEAFDAVGSVDSKSLKLNPNQVRDIESIKSHTFGWYDPDPNAANDGRPASSGSIRVLIEQAFYTSDDDRFTAEEKKIRIQSLAQLLSIKPKPIDFHVLDLIGTIEKKDGDTGDRVDFIFALPPACAKPPDDPLYRTPTTLLAVLGSAYNPSSRGRPSPKPALEQRFRLARALVISLHSLHFSGWIHKALSSINVLVTTSKEGHFDLSDPRLVNFRQSRPDGPTWFTKGPQTDPSLNDYQHPDYQGQEVEIDSSQVSTRRFQKIYDYYSLGMVLLEIGLWRPLKSISGQKAYLTLSPEQLRDEILWQYVPRLESDMGSLYRSVVERCLTSNFVRQEMNEGAENQLNDFNLNVVEKLLDIYVG